MASIQYDEITSSLYSKIEAYDFLDLGTDELHDFLVAWLHTAVSKPYVRKLFSSITLNDEIMVMKYDMKYEVDEETDREFVIEILALGMGIQWLTPKINSRVNINQMFGSKEEKYYSQSSHLTELRSLRKDWVKEQRSMIRDRGYNWNSYLDGES